MTWRFGVFEFDAASGELRRQGRLIKLEPQPARALTLLVSRAGDVVSRDELRAHLWGADTHVDFDRGIAYCIGQVRTALGDSSDNPRFVETLTRRGFRFVAPVLPSRDAAGDPPVEGVPAGHGGSAVISAAPGTSRARRLLQPWWPAAAVLVLAMSALVWTVRARVPDDRPLVAIAVFDNETGLADFDRLAFTAADVMVERLTALGADRLGVIGNTPVLRRPRAERDPGAVQRETDAAYFVFGQVQPDDEGVRMVVHLIRLDDDTHLWVTRVARASTDLADLQDVVADRLAEAVRRHVIERDPDAPRFTR